MPGLAISALSIGLLAALPAVAAPFFNTGNPDGKIATATRPDVGGKFEIESADDFVLATSNSTVITSATFTGLLTGTNPSVNDVVVEIYRVFPKDSDTGRTPNVPTRANSPSDVAFASRDSATPGDLTFTTNTLQQSFTAQNSVQAGGIHPTPNQTTKGDGQVTGTEVEFTVTFKTPLVLPPDHYFFVPQVGVDGGEFLWLSAPKPIVPPGTPFPPGFTDLQSWTRDQFLDPDWLRIGTDIVGSPVTGGPAPTFNAAFSLTGTVPEPASLGLLGTALSVMALAGLRRRRQS